MKPSLRSSLALLVAVAALVLPAGATTFRLLPPLIWGEQQVDEFVEKAAPILR